MHEPWPGSSMTLLAKCPVLEVHEFDDGGRLSIVAWIYRVCALPRNKNVKSNTMQWIKSRDCYNIIHVDDK